MNSPSSAPSTDADAAFDRAGLESAFTAEPGSLPGIRANPALGVSEEEIAAAETELGVGLPTDRGEMLVLAHNRLGGDEVAEEYAESFSGFLTRRLTETQR